MAVSPIDLLIETDIGRDPDDFFAIAYLAQTGVNIRGVTISPGDRDQVAVCKGLLKVLGLDVPVGSDKPDRNKSSVGGFHPHWLRRHGLPGEAEPDAAGGELIADVYAPETHQECLKVPARNRAGEVFREAMSLFFELGAPYKAFHDPTAAVCHLHPEIGTWIEGTPVRANGEWGFDVTPKSFDDEEAKRHGFGLALVDIDCDRLWGHIFNGD